MFKDHLGFFSKYTGSDPTVPEILIWTGKGWRYVCGGGGGGIKEINTCKELRGAHICTL